MDTDLSTEDALEDLFSLPHKESDSIRVISISLSRDPDDDAYIRATASYYIDGEDKVCGCKIGFAEHGYGEAIRILLEAIHRHLLRTVEVTEH